MGTMTPATVGGQLGQCGAAFPRKYFDIDVDFVPLDRAIWRALIRQRMPGITTNRFQSFLNAFRAG